MPASRRRSERWRESLEQIRDRGGGLEIAIDRRAKPGFRPEQTDNVIEPPKDLLWRVRLLDLTDDELVIESPGAVGRTVDIQNGTALLAVMSIGQNRWMFHSSCLGAAPADAKGHRTIRISMPERVERCTRRFQDRISTAELDLPDVRCWQILDPSTAVPAEIANRTLINGLYERGETLPRDDDELDRLGEVAPTVGRAFKAKLANIGGGGIGVRVGREEAGMVESSRLYWVRLDLRPHIPAPLELTCRLAHTHLDSAQNTYCGMAFEFGLNPPHKGFVADQMMRYMQKMQS